jgi:hypothetical protein
MKEPSRILWLCLDVSNGDEGSRHPKARNYAWAFNSREEARRQIKEHRKNEDFARLTGPFKYVRSGKVKR